jgi:hypothetical protein
VTLTVTGHLSEPQIHHITKPRSILGHRQPRSNGRLTNFHNFKRRKWCTEPSRFCHILWQKPEDLVHKSHLETEPTSIR